jgi:hypothetical protein
MRRVFGANFLRGARPSAAAVATMSSTPVVEEASEGTAAMTILFRVHRFGYAVKM